MIRANGSDDRLDSNFLDPTHFQYNGKTLFGDTKGTVVLGAALIVLEPHRFDRDKKGYLHTLMMRFVDYPDEVLFAVAAEIRELHEADELTKQPRYDALLVMVKAANETHNAIAGLLAERLK